MHPSYLGYSGGKCEGVSGRGIGRGGAVFVVNLEVGISFDGNNAGVKICSYCHKAKLTVHVTTVLGDYSTIQRG